MADLFPSIAEKAAPASINAETRQKLDNAAALQRMTDQGLFNGAAHVKAEHQVRSSNGISSVLAGPGLAALDERPVEVRKTAPDAPLHQKVRPLAEYLPPHSAQLLSMIVTRYEASKSEPVAFRVAEVAKHFDLPEDAAERAVGVLVSKALISRVSNGMGAPIGWMPTIPSLA